MDLALVSLRLRSSLLEMILSLFKVQSLRNYYKNLKEEYLDFKSLMQSFKLHHLPKIAVFKEEL